MTALADVWQLKELVLISRLLSVLQKKIVIDSGVTPTSILKKFFQRVLSIIVVFLCDWCFSTIIFCCGDKLKLVLDWRCIELSFAYMNFCLWQSAYNVESILHRYW